MLSVPSCLRALVATAILCSGLAFPSPVAADEQALRDLIPVWQSGRLARLNKYIGTQGNWAVLDDPYVVDSMKWVLRDKYETVRARLLSNPGVIDYYLFFIVLRGSLPTKGNHVEAAILVVDLTNGGLYAGLETGGKTIVFGNHGPDDDAPDYGELPWPLLFWVKQSELQHIGGEPPTINFEWRSKAPPPDGK